MGVASVVHRVLACVWRGLTMHTTGIKDAKIPVHMLFEADILVKQYHFCRIRRTSRDGVGVSNN
jgi:hypothetical protein